jgi:ATP-dependent RNA helicase HelY
MVPQLDAVLGLLQGWEYVSGWKLSAAGRRLRFIYNELDLLLAESLRDGLFGGLIPPETAALASVFTYEPRAEVYSTSLPTVRLEERARSIAETWERLVAAEEGAGVELTRPPEVGFADIAYRWASGSELRGLFAEDTTGVGDFVRNCRQLIDLMRQIAEVAPELQEAMRAAVTAVDRGVVAAAGAI